MFSKILIANRGEIACRVIRTAQQLGVQCVAVYSAADRQAQHVLLADEAIYIGPSPASESYLQTDRILAAAQQTGAQAIHPGYGFLSENEEFAAACEAAGIRFIGPPPAAIAAMGSKSAAKNIMAEAGVPLVPGYHGDDQDPDLILAEAHKIGFPVLLKAAYGGGGKGMRVVQDESEFAAALASARREAKASFGNDKMLVEKFIEQPRHVEIQVFCDQHGAAVYLGERDCSVQRRHQKVIEEAPAPGMTPATREAMGDAAVRAAQAIDYVGAGTVEFLFDAEHNFYFMEMNTRLQVEHPVTELVTGVDLVAWQLQVAAGGRLPLAQQDISLAGHAFEARIYAENANDNFMPSTGQVEHLRFPSDSTHVRVDAGIVAGDEITTFYDPMIAKLIVWDEDRNRALHRLRQALRQTQIAGVTTNLDYLYQIADHSAFKSGDFSTRFIEEYGAELASATSTLPVTNAHAITAALMLEPGQQPRDPWQSRIGWQLNSPARQRIRLGWQEEIISLQATYDSGAWRFTEPELRVQVMDAGEQQRVTVNGQQLNASLVETRHGYVLFTDYGRFDYDKVAELEWADDEVAGSLTAPLNGTIVTVNVQPGEQVTEGQTLIIMEAMKMEYTIKAPVTGTIEQVFYEAGDLVSDGAELLQLEPAETA